MDNRRRTTAGRHKGEEDSAHLAFCFAGRSLRVWALASSSRAGAPLALVPPAESTDAVGMPAAQPGGPVVAGVEPPYLPQEPLPPPP